MSALGWWWLDQAPWPGPTEYEEEAARVVEGILRPPLPLGRPDHGWPMPTAARAMKSIIERDPWAATFELNFSYQTWLDLRKCAGDELILDSRSYGRIVEFEYSSNSGKITDVRVKSKMTQQMAVEAERQANPPFVVGINPATGLCVVTDPATGKVTSTFPASSMTGVGMIRDAYGLVTNFDFSSQIIDPGPPNMTGMTI